MPGTRRERGEPIGEAQQPEAEAAGRPGARRLALAPAGRAPRAHRRSGRAARRASATSPRASRPSGGRRRRRRRPGPSSGFVTSQATRSAHAGEARVQPGAGPPQPRSSATRAPSARSSPAPPSVVALPPIPRTTSRIAGVEHRAQEVAGARGSWRPSASRSAGVTQRQPGRRRHLDDGRARRRRGASQAARIGRPSGSRGVRLAPGPAARRLDRDQRALAAVGQRAPAGSSSPGRARSQPSASARATSTLVSVPLNESGATRTRSGRPAWPPAQSPGSPPPPAAARRRSRYSGIRIIGGRSWSASSMHLERQPPAPGPRQLHRGAHLREQPRPPPLLEPLHHGLQDHERHPRQPLELLVAVDPPLEVHLAEPVDARLLGGVDQVPDLHRVPGEERQLLEQRAAPGVLARTAAG